jgi:hypothetical protein
MLLNVNYSLASYIMLFIYITVFEQLIFLFKMQKQIKGIFFFSGCIIVSYVNFKVCNL